MTYLRSMNNVLNVGINMYAVLETRRNALDNVTVVG